MKALIGYTGFVGSNLDKQLNFDIRYNSSNIHQIINKEFDLVVCAGVSGTKWIANKFPEKDLLKINILLTNLQKIKCKKIILISTVDVYKTPNKVSEDTLLDKENLHAYGYNRILVEEFIKENFKDYFIIRLPAIYGDGLKKNFVYDLLNSHCLTWTHKSSVFQYYHLKNLWKDIKLAVDNNIKVINFNSEPISAYELAKTCFDINFNNVTKKPPVYYDVRTKYSYLYNTKSDYMYNREQVISDMKDFANNYYPKK